MAIPTITTLQANLTTVTVRDLTIYFSYTTPVAFESEGRGLVVSENIWGTTTGKHLNLINKVKSHRIPNEVFMAQLANATND